MTTNAGRLELVLRGVVKRRDNDSATLDGATIDGFHNRDQLVLVGESPVDFVVVSRSQIDHHVFIAEEEHDRARVVQLVHCVELGDFGDVHQIDDHKVLDEVGNLPESLVLLDVIPSICKRTSMHCLSLSWPKRMTTSFSVSS